jgi:hypothetical protein
MAIDFADFADLKRNGSPSPGEETGEVCIPNISPLERRKRLRFAAQQFVITLVILAVMVTLHLNPLWRLFLQFLFSASTVSYFQAHDKT